MPGIYLIDSTIQNYLRSLGFNTERIFRKVGIPMDLGRGYYLDKPQYIHMMQELETGSDGANIVGYADIEKISAFVPPIFAGLCAADGEECLQRIQHYKRLVGPFILKMSKDEEELTLEFTFDDEEHTILPRFTQMTENLIITNLLRLGTGLRIQAKRIISSFEYTPEVIEHLGITPEKGDSNFMTFSLKDLAEPFLTENNIMWAYLEPELKKRIDELSVDESIAARVRTLLFDLIPAGNGVIEEVAKQMALSPRSLQRKLKEEETTFLKQLNHTKELLAKNYLSNFRITTDEVAYLLGYSEVYPFMRAFRQWTGMTVKQYRSSVDYAL